MIEILRLNGTEWLPIECVEVNITDSINIEEKVAEIKTMFPLTVNEVIQIYDDFGKFWGPAMVSSSEYSDGIYTQNCVFLYTKILKFFAINYASGVDFSPMFPDYQIDMESNILSNYLSQAMPICITDVDYDSPNSIINYAKSKNYYFRETGSRIPCISLLAKGSWSTGDEQYGGESNGWPSPIVVSDYDPGIFTTYVMGFGTIYIKNTASFLNLSELADAAIPISDNISNTTELSKVRIEYSYNGGITWLPALYRYEQGHSWITFDNANLELPFPIIYRITYTNSISYLNVIGQANPIDSFYKSYLSVTNPRCKWNSIFSGDIIDPGVNVDAIDSAKEPIPTTGIVSVLDGFKTLANYLKVPNKYPGHFLFYVRPNGTLVFGIDSIIRDNSDSVTLYQDTDILVDTFRDTGENKPSVYILQDTTTDGQQELITDGSHFRSADDIGSVIDISTENNKALSVKYFETINEEGSHMTGLECTLFSEKAKDLNVGDIVKIKLKDINEEFILQLNQKIYDGITIKGIFGEDIRHLVTAFKTLVNAKK
jgi:hypothetical protein